MKTKAFIFFCIFLIGSPAYSQWEDIGIQVSQSFSSVSFIDDNLGFVSGGNELYKTVDGGINWERSLLADTFAIIEEVLMVNDSLIVATGQDFKDHRSLIYRSTNSGESWTRIENSYHNFLSGLYFLNDDMGFTAGHNNIILQTVDSGLSWQKMNTPFPANTFLESIFFSSSLSGHVVGGIPGRSDYGRSLDGGLNWEEITINTNSFLQSVFFIDSLRGYIAGQNGEILVTHDAGENWTHQTSVNMGGNLEIVFTNDSTGFIVGGMSQQSSIQKTTDRGMTWQEVGPDYPNGLISVDFPSENTGYAVGQTGLILKTTNGGVTAVEGEQKETKLLIYPNPAGNSINIESSETIEQIHLFDGAGTKIQDCRVIANNHDLNITQLSPGNYFLLIRAGVNSGVRKIVKI